MDVITLLKKSLMENFIFYAVKGLSLAAPQDYMLTKMVSTALADMDLYIIYSKSYDLNNNGVITESTLHVLFDVLVWSP